ncbi:MAG: hypothetical protein C0514_04105 [Candidatus Puniceispirillum sp.]|nr:hypothetical protein [Candidatus Puniceispirillum sp.]
MSFKYSNVLVLSLCAGLFSTCALASDTDEETEGDRVTSLKRKAPNDLVKIGDTKRQCVEGTVRRLARARDKISQEPVQLSPQEKEGLMHMELYHKAASQEQKRAHAALAVEIFDGIIEGQENPGTKVLGWAASSHFRLASHCAPEEQYAQNLKAAQLYDRSLATREDPDHRFIASAAHAHFKSGTLGPGPQKLPHFREAVRLFSQAMESGAAPANLYLYTAVAHLEIGKRSSVKEKVISLQAAQRVCEDGLKVCPEKPNLLRQNLLRQLSYIHMGLGEYYTKECNKNLIKKG